MRLCAGALAALVGLIHAACAGQPIYPVISPPAATAFRAPHEAVWNATLQSLGIVPPAVVDPAQGHIVTGQFTYDMPVQGGGMRGGGAFIQILRVSMDILVHPAPDGTTTVRAQTTIHDAQQYGFWPGAGGPNSPEGDLFARIASHLAGR
ncbi:MAG TPA: hypothetical protein VED18_10275 [Candidatus Sulfotelmatobacter sp.]|nr:hypothetical protein [Candidatus Sulfotelmatobacter sp.]